MTLTTRGEQGRSADHPGRRPLLRGWLHVVAFVGWLIGGPFLVAAGPDAAAKAALAVYVAGMLTLFGTSAAFHRLAWSEPAWRRMRRADHSAIFVGIAGTSTAVAVLALRGWAQVLILAMVWGGAAAGIVLRQIWLDAPQWVVAVPYVVVGWCPIVVAPQLVRALGWGGFALMLAGGLAYTAGALVYARETPRPVAGCLRVPRGVPRVHPGGCRAVRLPGRLRGAAAVLIRRARRLPAARPPGWTTSPRAQARSRPSMAMALPRMIR